MPQVEGFDPESISIFSTKNQTKRSDQYFLDSASKVGMGATGAWHSASGQESGVPMRQMWACCSCGTGMESREWAVSEQQKHIPPSCCSTPPPKQVSFFFEEKAFDDKGRLTIDKNRAINKIGHGGSDASCAGSCAALVHSRPRCSKNCPAHQQLSFALT